MSKSYRQSKSTGLQRWFRKRWDLTPQERHNLQMAQLPVAVITASLGGHNSTAHVLNRTTF